MCTIEPGRREADAEVSPPVPPPRLRFWLAIAASLLSGFRAFLWVSSPLKARDFDQVWFAANALLSGHNPYAEVGPGLRFDWPAPLYYPLTAAVAVIPLAPIPRSAAAILFAAFGSGLFVWAATRRSLAPAVVITSGSAALAAEAVQWSPLLGAAYGVPWLGVLLCAKPTVGFAIWCARPSRVAVIGAIGLATIGLAFLPSWPADWVEALRHTSLATEGGTPYLAPIRSTGGMFAALAVLRWRRPEARLVLALACVPQTPLLYETLPLFLVPFTITEAGVLWLGSWIAALWLSLAGPFPSDLARFTVSANAIGWTLYVPATVMLLRRPNVGPTPERLERLVRRLTGKSTS
jgi:hypothetical protein